MKTERQFTNPDMIFACQEMEKMADNFFDYMGIEDTKHNPPLYSVIRKDERIFEVVGKFRSSTSNYTFTIDINLDNEDHYNSFGEKYFPELDD